MQDEMFSWMSDFCEEVWDVADETDVLAYEETRGVRRVLGD